MSQNDFVIANANGATVRADINGALQALASLSSGASAPGTVYANQWWHDDVNDILKIRDEANTVFINAFSKIGSVWVPYSNGAVLGTAANLNYAAINQNLTLSGKSVVQALASISSGSIDFATNAGNTISISGTATANTLGTVQAGFIGIIHYGVAVAVTHNATSRILPGGVSITTAIGDVEVVLSLGSGNWRTVSYTRADGGAISGPQVLSKTATYTVVDADRNSLIRFSGLAADVTLNLPAASGRSGFRVTLSNDDTSDWGVIVDPNSTELLDGFSTRKTYPGSRVSFVCDGTGWRSDLGKWRFFSGNQTITSAGGLTLAHGLGITPKNMWIRLKCTTAEAGYSAGEIMANSLPGQSGASSAPSVSLVPDATNLNVRFSSSAAVFTAANKTTGANVNLTNGNWAVQFFAEE